VEHSTRPELAGLDPAAEPRGYLEVGRQLAPVVDLRRFGHRSNV
jgi:hypothetical protein